MNEKENNQDAQEIEFHCPICGSDDVHFLTMWHENAPECRCGKCYHEGTMKEFSESKKAKE